MTKRVRTEQLPRGWPTIVRTALVQAIALGRFVPRRRTSELPAEIALLREELRIKDLRAARVAPARRPHYMPHERMAILELRAARGWSTVRTAAVFHVTEATIASWTTRLDEVGPAALVKTSEPVNKFSLVVTYLVKRLKMSNPELGNRKLAAKLARAGLHLGATTVARMLKSPATPPKPAEPSPATTNTIKAAQPHDVWHVDLTIVPIGGGFWAPWLPWALPQRLPFGHWVAAVVDGYSRRVLQLGNFAQQPTSRAIQKLLERTIREVGAKPRTIISDRGSQFDCKHFQSWCKRRKIRIRYGAVGKHGSIAVVERFIRTLKEYCRALPIVPTEPRAFMRELHWFQTWFNEHRPHAGLNGRTPNEVYERRFPAHRKPRYEPRAKWPRGSPCAKPWALTRGSPGAVLELDVEFLAGRRNLPIVTLRRVA